MCQRGVTRNTNGNRRKRGISQLERLVAMVVLEQTSAPNWEGLINALNKSGVMEKQINVSEPVTVNSKKTATLVDRMFNVTIRVIQEKNVHLKESSSKNERIGSNGLKKPTSLSLSVLK
jgi:hypothetical protein